ncbi:hypothetical protein RhiirB3_524387 [Rhizophagus irregularis]|nr:hypothetical protein RhiirB3_524387 [Rhizophagus irregularis]
MKSGINEIRYKRYSMKPGIIGIICIIGIIGIIEFYNERQIRKKNNNNNNK